MQNELRLEVTNNETVKAALWSSEGELIAQATFTGKDSATELANWIKFWGNW